MALPFNNPVSQCMPGFGSPSCYGSATQTATATGTVTITIGQLATTPTASGTAFNLSGMPAPTSGKWHLRVVAGTTTATIAVTVQVTDGTNTWTVGGFSMGSGYTLTPGYLDHVEEFKTDVSITSVIFIVVIGGTATSVPIDAEVSLV
jgi:hypothetical protein